MNQISPVQNTNVIRYADFFQLNLAGTNYYFATTSAPVSVRLNSATNVYTDFTAVGQLVKVNGAQRDIKSTANETTVTLVGVDTSMLGLVLNSNIKGSPINLWHGFFDSNNQLITTSSTISWTNNLIATIGWTNSLSAPIDWVNNSGTGLYKYFSGYVNSFSISEEWMEEARSYVGVVTISASSFQLILQNRTAGRYTNDNSWQSFNSGDTSMNRVTFVSTINYQFGKTA